MNDKSKMFVESLRLASPYMVEYQNKVFLVMLNMQVLQREHDYKFIEDLLLLHRIGNHLIFIPDLGQQLDQPIDENQRDTLINLEQQLWNKFQSLWFKNSKKPDLIKTNLLQVRPKGVQTGKDFLFASETQGIFDHSLRQLLDQKWAIWQASWGLSFSGIPYVLNALDVALKISSTLHCDKLIYLNTEKVEFPGDSNNLSIYEAKKLAPSPWINMAIDACKSGISRVHFLNTNEDGIVLSELFTRDGLGLLIYSDIYDELMVADESCINGILDLIHAYQKTENVLQRNKADIDKQLKDFYVMRREGEVIACVAIHPLSEEVRSTKASFLLKQAEIAEISCLIVRPDYQSMGIASQLIKYVIRHAKKQKIKQLIALTTQAQGWFQRHGFKTISPQNLPKFRKTTYDYNRNSTVLLREL